ncbi:hypothetical protein Tco_0136059, partial [Tanacetum coccineum]
VIEQLMARSGMDMKMAKTCYHSHFVRSPSPYNGIIRRPRVRKLQAVLSTIHEMLKIPVEEGVITLKSSRIKVAINPEYQEQTVMIGSTLTEEGHNKLCGLLQRNLDIFAWKPHDWHPNAYYKAPLERVEGMFFSQTKEKGTNG